MAKSIVQFSGKQGRNPRRKIKLTKKAKQRQQQQRRKKRQHFPQL